MPILVLALIFVVWLGYEIKKSSGDSAADSKQFWARESEALMTPRKSIDDVHFITIPEEVIPNSEFDIPEDCDDPTPYERIKTLSKELLTMSQSKVADLSEYTNTDLRLKYGSPNFTLLSTADTNYSRLVQLMPILLSSLIETKRFDEAHKLLDFCEENGVSSLALTRIKNDFGES